MESEEIINSMLDASTINSGNLIYAHDDLGGVQSTEESVALTDYIMSSLDETGDSSVVEIVAAAMQMASETGALEIPTFSPLQTAMTATSLVKDINYSYLIDKGADYAEEIGNRLIDNAAVQLSVTAQVLLAPDTLETAMDCGLDVVSAYCPPLQPVAQFAKQFTRPVANFVSNKVRPVVQSGIKKVTQVAKTGVHNVVNKAKTFVKTTAVNTARKIVNWFK